MKTTDDRLRAALADRAAQASPSPDAYRAITEKVRRRRVVGRLQLAGGLVATVAVAAVAVTLVDTDPAARPGPVVPATGEPTPTPAAPTSPPATATPSGPPSATAAPGVLAEGEAVAFLEDGRLVALSAVDGSVRRVLHDFGPDRKPAGAPAISPDRSSVVVSTDDEQPTDCVQTLTLVDLATGRTTDLGAGRHPAISPDGRRLASISTATQCNTDAPLVLRDLDGGNRVVIPVDGPSPDPTAGPAYLAAVTWHADSRRVYVVEDWESDPILRLVDPAVHRAARDGERVPTAKTAAFPVRRGPGLVYLHTCCYPEHKEPSSLRLYTGPGQDREIVSAPPNELTPFAVGPDGDVLFRRTTRLYRHDPETGVTTDLGAHTVLALAW
jgi:hypothetical protein